MPNSRLLDLPAHLALVCHDAGAANHIFAWVTDVAVKQPDAIANWRLLTQGPAASLWAQHESSNIRLCQGLDDVLEGAKTLIAGTGWASDLEYEAIKKARERNIPVIGVIDHWLNYQARFERHGVIALPDEIWVTDEYAKRLAEAEFGSVKVELMPNLYLDHLVAEVKLREHVDCVSDDILYLLEPIRAAWGEDVESGEFAALDYFVKNLDVLGLSDKQSMRLRPHPSDPVGKYNEWIKAQKKLKVTLDCRSSLAESIARSGVVVGCQTYAMVVALAAGKKVYSSIPAWAPPCVLPQKDIVKVSELVREATACRLC